MVDVAKTPVGKIIAEEIFQYLVWTSQKLEKFPRSYKFTIGDRIQNLSLELLAATVEATYTRDRAALLRQGQLAVEQLRYLFRLSVELRLVNAEAYEHAARCLTKIGSGLGGWRKKHDAQTTRQSVPTNRDVSGAANSREQSDQG